MDRLWEVLRRRRFWSIARDDAPGKATPVYTVNGKYTARGWTEWTQGFVYGSAILQFDATYDETFLNIRARARRSSGWRIISRTSGVHDHGFNNVSTYGNLWRLMREGRIPANAWERNFYELALKCSGRRAGEPLELHRERRGFIYSFNGPHSLFADTIRSLRALAVSHRLGHVLMGEKDRKFSLLERLIEHARTTAQYAVYYGEGRDAYDIRGRTAHESIFNVNDGNYRCPNSQQGYSPFTHLDARPGVDHVRLCGAAGVYRYVRGAELEPFGGRQAMNSCCCEGRRRRRAIFTSSTRPTDGIPYWDTGAPNLHKLGNYLDCPADPFNDCEPVDSSAAAIAAHRACCGSGMICKRAGTEARTALLAGGADGSEHAL